MKIIPKSSNTMPAQLDTEIDPAADRSLLTDPFPVQKAIIDLCDTIAQELGPDFLALEDKANHD